MKDSFKSYRDLEVWQKSMGLAKEVYQVTSSFPTDEKFGLTNQMRRAAVSIPSNLAEGHARSGTQEFKHFISMAIGSVAELETQILLSAELGYLNENRKSDLFEQLDIIGKMLRGLYKSLNKKKGCRFSTILKPLVPSPKSQFEMSNSSLKSQASSNGGDL